MKLNPANKLDYDIMTALRGPDDGNHAMKTFTTAVLRYLVGMTEIETWSKTYPTQFSNGAEVCTIEKALRLLERLDCFAFKETARATENYHHKSHAKKGFIALIARNRKHRKKFQHIEAYFQKLQDAGIL